MKAAPGEPVSLVVFQPVRIYPANGEPQLNALVAQLYCDGRGDPNRPAERALPLNPDAALLTPNACLAGALYQHPAAKLQQPDPCIQH